MGKWWGSGWEDGTNGLNAGYSDLNVLERLIFSALRYFSGLKKKSKSGSSSVFRWERAEIYYFVGPFRKSQPLSIDGQGQQIT